MKVLIAEDEAAAGRRLERMIKVIKPDYEIDAIIETVSGLKSWFQTHNQPDLFLCDIHLADGTCFDFFSTTEITCPVIFITAYDQYAIKAFKLNSIDYLLKPVKEDELKQAFEKYHRSRSDNNILSLLEQMLKQGRREPRRLMVKYGHYLKSIPLDSIAIFYAKDGGVSMITKEGQIYPADQTLEQLELLCEPASFFRINRQVLLNIDSISKMWVHSKGRIKIEPRINCPVECIVSTDRAAAFRIWLTGTV